MQSGRCGEAPRPNETSRIRFDPEETGTFNPVASGRGTHGVGDTFRGRAGKRRVPIAGTPRPGGACPEIGTLLWPGRRSDSGTCRRAPPRSARPFQIWDGGTPSGLVPVVLARSSRWHSPNFCAPSPQSSKFEDLPSHSGCAVSSQPRTSTFEHCGRRRSAHFLVNHKVQKLNFQFLINS